MPIRSITSQAILIALTSTAAVAYDTNDIQRASGSIPIPKPFAQRQDVFEYDLKVQNICDKPDSLNAVAAKWVGPKRTLNIFDPDYTIYDRSIALAAVVTYPNAPKDKVKQVKIPILTISNFGDTNVQNCEGTIVSDVPANTKVNVHFEYRRSETVRFNDPTKFVAGIAKIGSSAASLGAIGTGAVVLGATLAPAVSYLEKNTTAITTLNTGVNEIMESFSDVRSPDPRQYELRSTAGSFAYNSRRTPIITIQKIARDTGPLANGLNGWPGVAQAFSDRYGSLSAQFVNAQTSVDAPWSGNLPKFCGKLRGFLDGVVNGDRYARALGLGFHAFYNSTEYNGKTCLDAWDVSALKSHNFAPPFPGAWPTEANPGQAIASRPAARQAGRHARSTNIASLR